MALKRGSATLSTAYRGNDQLSKIYVGSTLIWPTTTPTNEVINYNSEFSFNTLLNNETKYSSTFALKQ